MVVVVVPFVAVLEVLGERSREPELGFDFVIVSGAVLGADVTEGDVTALVTTRKLVTLMILASGARPSEIPVPVEKRSSSADETVSFGVHVTPSSRETTGTDMVLPYTYAKPPSITVGSTAVDGMTHATGTGARGEAVAEHCVAQQLSERAVGAHWDSAHGNHNDLLAAMSWSTARRTDNVGLQNKDVLSASDDELSSNATVHAMAPPAAASNVYVTLTVRSPLVVFHVTA